MSIEVGARWGGWIRRLSRLNPGSLNKCSLDFWRSERRRDRHFAATFENRKEKRKRGLRNPFPPTEADVLSVITCSSAHPRAIQTPTIRSRTIPTSHLPPHPSHTDTSRSTSPPSFRRPKSLVHTLHTQHPLISVGSLPRARESIRENMCDCVCSAERRDKTNRDLRMDLETV